MGKTAYRQRIKAILKGKRAQNVAKAKFSNFKSVCKEVVKKHGAASRT